MAEESLITSQLEEFRKEFRNINNKLDIFNEKFIDYKTKPIECREIFDKRYLKVAESNVHINTIGSKFDRRYVKRDEFKSMLLIELDFIQDQKINKLDKKANIIKNILSIAQAIAPYVILLSIFILSNS